MVQRWSEFSFYLIYLGCLRAGEAVTVFFLKGQIGLDLHDWAVQMVQEAKPPNEDRRLAKNPA